VAFSSERRVRNSPSCVQMSQPLTNNEVTVSKATKEVSEKRRDTCRQNGQEAHISHSATMWSRYLNGEEERFAFFQRIH
jgi:hypothetical protein